MDFLSVMDMMIMDDMMIEEKIEECLEAARRGETEIKIDTDWLTDDEIEYIRQ